MIESVNERFQDASHLLESNIDVHESFVEEPDTLSSSLPTGGGGGVVVLPHVPVSSLVIWPWPSEAFYGRLADLHASGVSSLASKVSLLFSEVMIAVHRENLSRKANREILWCDLAP